MSKKNKTIIIDIIGWYGAVAELLAYFLVSFGIMKPQALPYQLLNLTGALGLGILCYSKKAYQPFFVNTIWVIIAFLELANIFFIYIPR